MFHKVVLFSVSLVFLYCSSCAEPKKLDFKVITAVRHGLENSLEYIDRNLYRSNVDCILGVAFVRAFMKTSYKNGSHVMDKSSLRILNKSSLIIEKSRLIFERNVRNGNNWKFKSLVYNDIWNKTINFTEFHLLPFSKTPNDHLLRSKISRDWFKGENSDTCLQEIVNSTDAQKMFRPCVVTTECWNEFFRNAKGHGYYLTHKLLLLQIAKARKCLLNKKFYDKQVRDICSSIMFEIVIANYYGKVEELFDLFLEQVLLCGYEGYSEFVQNDWLFRILKSQHLTGCFPDNLADRLKSRIKKNVNYFEDGCNDHTTGLGAAVLGLYYNYIVNEEIM